MNSNAAPILAVPTNIITGFLGVGKTSAILHLLKSKPANERWAVLVNEFGEIGVDGSLFEGKHAKRQGVFVREVPGGCMCCAAGLPMQIALSQLLSEARPDRLLIEPTGLGHPKEVLEVLTSEYYQEVLALQKTLTLVDARTLSDERYTNHATFNQQIAMADLIVGNKVDLYREGDTAKLANYVRTHAAPQTEIVLTQNGDIPFSLLSDPSANHLLNPPGHHHHHHHHKQDKPLASELPLPESGFLKAENQDEGYSSIGWRFSASKVFDYQKLSAFLLTIRAVRMKAVFITNTGVFGYNLTLDALDEMELDDAMESRIEIISDQQHDNLEPSLLDCVLA
ncbi:CobW family GTP-binding protein [Enterovibrio norvegicus]|uniref:CobW family GTP-binding protein n=1 Tax=Enterovibrio norvegicus TaxID=188144 RepID=UPI00355052E3